MYTVDAELDALLTFANIRRKTRNGFEDLRIDKKVRLLFASIVALVSAIAIFATPAQAHQAPKGWAYPYQCCHDRDCRQIHGADVSEGPNGYVIKQTGEVVGYKDARLRDSPDGDYHWCSVAGNNKTSTICLFVPPRSF